MSNASLTHVQRMPNAQCMHVERLSNAHRMHGHRLSNAWPTRAHLMRDQRKSSAWPTHSNAPPTHGTRKALQKGAMLLKLPCAEEENQRSELVVAYEAQGGQKLTRLSPSSSASQLPSRQSKVLGLGRKRLSLGKSFGNLHDQDTPHRLEARSQHREMGSFHINRESRFFQWWARWMYFWLLFTAIITPFQFGFLLSIGSSEFAGAGM